MSVRKGDLLSTVATPEEALRHVALFVQHYREEARYLERTYHYLQRVGVDAVRAATVDAPAAEQEGLLERFARAKARVREPWSTEGASPRTPLQFGALPTAEPAEHEPVDRPVTPVPAFRSLEAADRGEAMLAGARLGVG
jgi:nitrite reductase (NADH) large subunit